MYTIAYSLSKCHRVRCTCAMRKDRHVPDIELVQDFFNDACPLHDTTRCAWRWFRRTAHAPAVDTDEAQVERTCHLVVQRRHITDTAEAEEHYNRSPSLASCRKVNNTAR